MSDYNSTLYPIPERNNALKMKEFMKMKYEAKRFMDEDSKQDPEGSDSDTKHKKHKKHKKKKRKVSSSSEEEEKSSESEEEE